MSVYHLELRKFPHTVCRFNQSEAQLRAIVVPWTGEQWIEEGERKWNSNEATLTVLEGPKLSMPELAMGRGWRNAQRRSVDVTERVLASFGQPPAERAGPSDPAPDAQLLVDSLALELLALLDAGPAQLSRAWQLAAERLGDAPASQSLALAEQAVRSLVARGLAVLQAGGADAPQAVAEQRIEPALRGVEGWAGGQGESLQIARKA